MSEKTGSPIKAINTIPAEKARETTRSLLELNQLGKPETDQEIEQRIADYFDFCADSSIRPGIQALASALHVDRTTFWRWTRGIGCSPYVQEVAQNAKGLILAFIEQQTLSGGLNPVSAIFMLKNWGGYADAYRVETDEVPKVHKSNTDILREIEEMAGAIGVDIARKADPKKPGTNDDPYFD